MSLHYFDRASLVPTPWKNGGGVTREIACFPPGAVMDAFDWRISIATIAADGPFSVFEGVDRVITLLDGAGMRLRARDGSFDHLLDTPLAPFAFPGEAPVDCTLLAGESQDFNVMTRRGKLQAKVQVLAGPQRLEACRHGLLMATRGAWRLDAAPQEGQGETGRTLNAEAGVWWSGDMTACRLTPLIAEASLIAVQLVQANP